MKKLISLIIPAYNEEKSLENLFPRLDKIAKQQQKYDFDFLFVNDGSSDKTLEIIQKQAKKDSRISFINFSRNFGKEIAVAAGIDYADGDAVVIIDADGQMPPEKIPEMLSWWEKGYDDVYARRQKYRGVSFLTRLTSRIYYRTLQKTTRVPIQVDTGDFRLFSRRAILALREFQENQRQNKALFSWIGFKKKEIFFDQESRHGGKTKWNFWSRLNLAIDGFTSFTTAPLRFASLLGAIIALGAFIYIIVAIGQFFAGVDRTGGYTTLLASVLFLGGIQLLALGIIGEYVGRIFTESKNRPLYLIQDYHQSKTAKGKLHDDKKKSA